jgi:hypothetical protein
MTQAELNRAVACATGESVSAIAEMGFITLTPIPVRMALTSLFARWLPPDLWVGGWRAECPPLDGSP